MEAYRPKRLKGRPRSLNDIRAFWKYSLAANRGPWTKEEDLILVPMAEQMEDTVGKY